MQQEAPYTLFDLAEVKARTGYRSSTSVYALMRDHGFPEPIRVGRTRRWVASEVFDWIETTIKNHRNESQP